MTGVTAGDERRSHIRLKEWEAFMFPAIQSSSTTWQVYSPFGSFMVESHTRELPRRYLEDLPRPDVAFGEAHPLAGVQTLVTRPAHK